MDPEAHKNDTKIMENQDKLDAIDKQEKEKEAEILGLQRKKHVISSTIQAKVMNNHLEHLASDAANGGASTEGN